MSWSGSGDRVWSMECLRTASDAAGVALWSWNVDTDEVRMDERGQPYGGCHGTGRSPSKS